MAKKKDMEKILQKHKADGKVPIFRAPSETHANMRRERFIIPQETSAHIVKEFHLPEEQQEFAVNKLVDRTPDWLEMSTEEQTEEIKAVLLMETVAYYLYASNYIQEGCNMYENGFDKDGNIVLDAFYIKEGEFSQHIQKIQEEKKKKEADKIIAFPKKGLHA